MNETGQLRVLQALVWAAAALVTEGTARAQSDAVHLSYLQGQLPKGDATLKTPGTDLIGDRVNPVDGSLSFQQTDIAVPGNGPLPMAIVRSHVPGRSARVQGDFGDWDLELPRIGGVFAMPDGWVTNNRTTNRCSDFFKPPIYTRAVVTPPSSPYPNPPPSPPPPGGPGDHNPNLTSPFGRLPEANRSPANVSPTADFEYTFASFAPDEYWQGTHLTVPGRGQQEVLYRNAENTPRPADNRSYPLVTAGGWQIGCIPSASAPNARGEAFHAVSPEGVRYTFAWMSNRLQPALRKGLVGLPRNEFALLATEVVDRFGHWVRYTYSGSQPARLSRITSSDGRRIDLARDAQGRVIEVSSSGRVWTYTYDADGSLRSVVQPDNAQWTFNLRPLVHLNTFELGELADCYLAGYYPDLDYVGTITHPSGVSASFTLRYTLHGRTDVTQLCEYEGNRAVSAHYPKSVVKLSLVSKVLTGPGIGPLKWTYNYTSPIGRWTACSDCVSQTTLTAPDLSARKLTFGARFRINEGQLLREEDLGSDGAVLRVVSYQYRQPDSSTPYTDQIGESYFRNSDYLSSRHRPIAVKRTDQQGETFTWQATEYDVFARVTANRQVSSLGYSRTEALSFHDHLPGWVLGQLASRTIDGWLVEEAHAYSASTALRTSSSRFGLRTDVYTHHTGAAERGLLATRADNVNPPTRYAAYRRGVPTSVTYPDGARESVTVDNHGWITSHTNAAGTTQAMDYDAMGRLVRWSPAAVQGLNTDHPTNHTYEQMGSADVALGLSAGHWRQTSVTGNAAVVRWYDALWQERLRLAYDIDDPQRTARALEWSYDHEGRTTFQSFPSRALGGVFEARLGERWRFDGLGRVVSHRVDQGSSTAQTTTAYASGFSRVVTDPRSKVTEFRYQAYGTPHEDWISSINAPEGVRVDIARDPVGKPTAISRSGDWAGNTLSATRSYRYDAHQRLCKTIEPEANATIQHYDAAGNVQWRAFGQTLTGPNCDQGSVPAARHISFTYDQLNRLVETSFGDGYPAISRSYTADGLLSRLASGSFTWTYEYNPRRLLVAELLSLTGQTPGQGWNFRYGIDQHGNLASLSDPWGEMSFAPNALGEATQVSGYVSEVERHPDGSIAAYIMANGRRFAVTQDSRGRPQRWHHQGLVDYRYRYDHADNVIGISDEVGGEGTRTLAYDGLNRLIDASGVWGTGRYTYDPLDNLRSSRLGARTLTHHVDAASNRMTSLSGSQSVAFAYDANGNVTRRGGQGYHFDIANRLRSATGKATYDYDGHGRRSGVVWADQRTQLNAYTGLGAAGRLRFSHHSTQGSKRYVYLDGLAVAEHGTSGVTFLHTDALGSPVARTNAAGTLLSRTRFEPFGATAAGTAPTSLGFTGHVNDLDTGLVYMQQRYYDPIAGRFLSVDPVVTDAKTGGSFNRYAYGNNNPYRFKDPDGRSALDIGFFMVDAFNFGVAVYTGVGIPAAAADLAASTIGLASPVPGVGQALKAVRTVDKVADVAKGVEKTASGKRLGDFTKSQREAAKAENAAANGGQMKCTDCGKAVESIKSEKGVPTPGNQAQVHHDPAIKDGGGQHSTPVVVCPDCHKDRH